MKLRLLLIAIVTVLLAGTLAQPAAAQSGIYISQTGGCTGDTRLTAPITGRTFCFDQVTNNLYKWTGSWAKLALTSVPVLASEGGTGLNTSALTGVPSLASGVWSIGAVKPPATGSGTGIFAPASCASIGTPLVGVSECLNTTTGVWYNYDGTGWQSDAALSTKVLNVTDQRFGAKCDGSTDDTTAITNAVAALPAQGGVVYFPGGSTPCRFSSLTITKSNVTIRGAGRSLAGGGGTASSPSRLACTAASGACISVAGSVEVSNFVTDNIELVGNTTADYGVRFLAPAAGAQFCVHCALLATSVTGFTKTGARGVSIEGGVTLLLDRSYIAGNYDNLYLDGGTAQNVTTVHVRDTALRSATRYGLYDINAPNLLVSGMGTVIESNGSQGVYLDSSVATYSAIFRDVYIGSNTAGGTAYQVVLGGAAGSWRNVVLDGVFMADGIGAHDIHAVRVITGSFRNIAGAAGVGKNILLVDNTSSNISVENIQDSGGGAVDPTNNAVYSFPNSASGSNGLGLRIGTGLTDPGVGKVNISGTDGYQVGGTALKNIIETLSNKTLASPSLSGTVSGTPTIASAWTWTSSQQFPAIGVNMAPSGTISLVSQASSGNFAAKFFGAAGAGLSYGLRIAAGSTSGDYALRILKNDDATDYFAVFGDGGVVHGSPTGGDPGSGKINIASADGYLVNNVALKNITETLSNKTLNAPTFSGTAVGPLDLTAGAVQRLISLTSAIGTNPVYMQITNTGGTASVGAESSTGGALATGSSAYALAIVSAATRAIQLAPGGTMAGTWTAGGGLQVGSPTGGDKGSGTLNIATADGYFVNNVALKNITETLSNKTLASPVLSGTVTGVYTLGGTLTLSSPLFSGTATGPLDITAGAVARLLSLTTATGTNPVYMQITNTGGTSYFGADSSVGGVLAAGTLAYASVIAAAAAKAVQVAPGAAVTGTWTSGGGYQQGSPTGGDKGPGTINIAGTDGYLVNGTALKNVTETLSNKTLASPTLFTGLSGGSAAQGLSFTPSFNTLLTATSFFVQGTTVKNASGAGNREMLGAFSFTSNTGSVGCPSVGGSCDKVALYADIGSTTATTGNIWALNTVTAINTTQRATQSSFGYELDLNNISGTDNTAFAVPQSYGLAITGGSAAATPVSYYNTAALWITGGSTFNPHQWAYGVAVGPGMQSAGIKTASFYDTATGGTYSSLVSGSYTTGFLFNGTASQYGIAVLGTTVNGLYIGGTPSGSSLVLYKERSTTGTRYLCVDTVGNVTSSAAACSGT